METVHDTVIAERRSYVYHIPEIVLSHRVLYNTSSWLGYGHLRANALFQRRVWYSCISNLDYSWNHMHTMEVVTMLALAATRIMYDGDRFVTTFPDIVHLLAASIGGDRSQYRMMEIIQYCTPCNIAQWRSVRYCTCSACNIVWWRSIRYYTVH